MKKERSEKINISHTDMVELLWYKVPQNRKAQEKLRQPQENQALPPPSSEELQRRPIKENHLKQVVEPPKAEAANEGGAASFEEFM